MASNRKMNRDPFAFSLRGMSALAPFTAPVAIADDRITRAARNRPSASQPSGAPSADWRPAEQPG